jgi:hypothetical protein
VVFGLVFFRHLGRVVRHPDRHPRWAVGKVQLITEHDHQGPAMLILTLEPRAPMYVGRSRVEIVDPMGNVWLEHSPDSEPNLVRRLITHYPTSFPDAPPIRSGLYRVRWMIGTKGGGLRELLRHDETVTLS